MSVLKKIRDRKFSTVASSPPEPPPSPPPLKADSPPGRFAGKIVGPATGEPIRKCIQCDGRRLWLPRKQFATEDDWKCLECHPPASFNLVGKVYTPSAVARDPFGDTQKPVATNSRSGKNEIVVAMERVVCKCGCRWMLEIPTEAGTESVCWHCRSRLELDAFD